MDKGVLVWKKAKSFNSWWLTFYEKKPNKILSQLGFKEFLEAEDGIQAVKEFEKQNNIDLITLDITMMGMDGITALERMYEINKNCLKS